MLVEKKLVSVSTSRTWNELIKGRNALRMWLTTNDCTHCDRGRRSSIVNGLPAWSSNNEARRSCEIRDDSDGAEPGITCGDIVETGRRDGCQLDDDRLYTLDFDVSRRSEGKKFGNTRSESINRRYWRTTYIHTLSES